MGNTGKKIYLRLEEYTTGDGLATGNYKVNDSGDPDYVAPVTDTGTCPLPAAADTTNPTFPTSLTAPFRDTTSIGLNWGSSDNVEVVKQRLYWKPAASGTYNRIYVSKSTGAYTVTGLTDGTSYNFYIKAWDRYGNITNSNTLTYSTVASDTTNPTFTTQPYWSSSTQTSFTVNWVASDNVGVTTQLFYYKESFNPTYTMVNIGSGDTSRIQSGLASGTTYNIYIEAYDAAGNFVTSNVVNATTDSATPVSVSPTYKYYDSFGGSFTLTISNASGSWSSSDNATWLSNNPTSGTSGSTTVTAAENTDNFPKSGRVTITNNGNSAFCDVDIDEGFGGCLIHGSKITMVDGSIRNIEDLVVGDVLLGAKIKNFIDTNDINKLREQKLNELNFNDSNSIVTKIEALTRQRVISLNDGLFTATPHHTHIYKLDGKWVFMPLGLLDKGDIIMDRDGNEIVVYKREVINEEHTVYKLTLESPTHTFFGNNILTHNIK